MLRREMQALIVTGRPVEAGLWRQVRGGRSVEACRSGAADRGHVGRGRSVEVARSGIDTLVPVGHSCGMLSASRLIIAARRRRRASTGVWSLRAR
jgi:hypothetical protein